LFQKLLVSSTPTPTSFPLKGLTPIAQDLYLIFILPRTPGGLLAVSRAILAKVLELLLQRIHRITLLIRTL
jgi:hypothetical protein